LGRNVYSEGYEDSLVVEHLASMCEALSPILSAMGKKN
jgi:hypothetical protein